MVETRKSANPPKPPASPDGSPSTLPQARRRKETGSVSEVDDPLIAGDSGKKQKREADEPQVDEAGQISRKPTDIDLLH